MAARQVLFAAVAAGLALSGLILTLTGDSGALVMCGVALAGMWAGRRVGLRPERLAWMGGGLGLVIWLLWLGALGDGRLVRSAFAHFTGAAVLAIGLVGPVRRARHRREPGWAATLVLLILLLGILWELAEWGTDALLETALAPSARDSTVDLAADLAGAIAGAAVGGLLAPSSPSGTARPIPGTERQGNAG